MTWTMRTSGVDVVLRESFTYWDSLTAPDIERLARQQPMPTPPEEVPLSERGYLGSIPDINSEPGGVLPVGVAAGSPAEAAGLRAGDIIIAIGADTVTNLPDMQKALIWHRAGDSIDVRVRRTDQIVRVQVTLGRRR